MIDNTTLNNIAHQKLLTSNPGTKYAISITSNALITKINKPRVRIVIGKVRITSTGLIIALAIPNASAVNNATTKPVT